MGGGKAARRQAEAAAAQSREEAARLREQTEILKNQTKQQKQKSQTIMMRALRARGGGFFETDQLGGGGSLG